MSPVRRYKDISTNIGSLFEDVLEELRREKELNVVNELEGTIKTTGKLFKSITAVRTNIPDDIIGALRELSITITGDPNDFVIEIHTGGWSNNLLQPDTKIEIERNLNEIRIDDLTCDFSVKYQINFIKRIEELIRKNSKKNLTINNIESFTG